MNAVGVIEKGRILPVPTTSPIPVISRHLDPDRELVRLVNWFKNTLKEQNWFPDEKRGIALMISGTDSILTLLIAAKAIKELESENTIILNDPNYIPIVAIHFGPKNHSHIELLDFFKKEGLAEIIDFRFEELTPEEKKDDEASRYFRASKLARQDWRWLLGTRNRSEDLLGNYSIPSTQVVGLPIIGLYKSEVLKFCEHFGIPKKLIEQSRCPDAGCGRNSFHAANIDNIDRLLMIEAHELNQSALETIPKEVVDYVKAVKTASRFRKMLPYRPS